MARQNHAVQHRSGRESKQVELKNELQELRTQNQKLRRENARLRRENSELYSREGVTDPVEVEAPLTEGIGLGSSVAFECPSRCGQPLKHVAIPGKTLKVCPVCHWRTTQ